MEATRRALLAGLAGLPVMAAVSGATAPSHSRFPTFRADLNAAFAALRHDVAWFDGEAYVTVVQGFAIENPARALLHLLTEVNGWERARIDLASFEDAAAAYDGPGLAVAFDPAWDTLDQVRFLAAEAGARCFVHEGRFVLAADTPYGRAAAAAFDAHWNALQPRFAALRAAGGAA